MNAALRDEIAAAYTALGGAVAVRSSATAEDLPDASFAGQQETFLDVEGDDAVLAAVEGCWASLFSERAIAYRGDRNIADADVAMAVVVQRMVPAEAAGVLFTVNPVSGDTEEMVVEAARGLGDAVVSARVTPVRYRIRRRAPHDVIATEGAIEEPTLLRSATLAELAELGLRAERLLGRAADVEWALAAGKLWLLQARSVTALGGAPPQVEYGSKWDEEACRGKLTFFSNHNFRETMPYPHTPFSASVWRDLFWRLMLASVAGADAAAHYDAWPSGQAFVEGRIYWNLNVGAGLLTRWVQIGATRQVDAEVAALLEEKYRSGELQPTRIPWRLRRRAIPNYLRLAWSWLKYWPPTRAWQALHAAEREVESFRRADVAALPDETVLAMARYFVRENTPRAMAALGSAVFAFPVIAWLEWALPHWGFPQAFRRLLAGIGNPTLDTALALWDIAEHAAPEVRLAFGANSNSDLPQRLAETPAGRGFLDQLQNFLRAHGHRSVREFDLACPRWRDDPAFVYDTLRNYMQHPPEQPTPRHNYERLVRERAALKQEIDTALRRRPLRRWLFRKGMRSLERRFPLREAFKFYGMMGTAHLRDMYLEIARRFVHRGVLVKEDDFFYLSIPEIEQIAGQGAPSDLAATIAARRHEFVRQLRAHPPLVVRSDGKPLVFPTATGDVLRGTPVSWGTVRGKVRVLLDPADGAHLQPGEILVAPFTDPGWTPLFLTAGGLVMEVGGIISHGAVVAREYGIPAVVGVRDATRVLHDGDTVEVNGATGEVRKIPGGSPAHPAPNPPS
jgi:pyruvate,water dikinase